MRDIVALTVLGAAGLASAGSVSIDVTRKYNSQLYDVLKVHRRGDSPLDVKALNNITGGGYYATFGIGTPPQLMTLHLDTGSSDTWVNLKGNSFCKYGRPELQVGPSCLKQFDPSLSSTYEVVDEGGFKIGYLDGSTSSGDYFNDTVTISDSVKIKQQQLGLARKSTSPTGLMGLGLSVGVASEQIYPTIIDNLVSQGAIDTPAFSLYLDSISQSSGSFLFGGLDTKKYIDTLTTLLLEADTLHGSDNVTSYAVSLEGLSVDGVDTPSLKTKAIFDTGATLILLPGRIAKPIFDKFGIVTIPDLPTPFVDCATARKKEFKKARFNFQFNGKTIFVPIREMIVDSFATEQDIFKTRLLKSYFKDMDKVCMFGIANADNYKTQAPPSDPYGIGSDNTPSADEPEYALLGDTFLRSAYLVYDLAGQKISIAQAYPKSNDTNVVHLKANSTIPSIKGMDAPDASVWEESSAAFATAPSAALAGAVALFAAVLAL